MSPEPAVAGTSLRVLAPELVACLEAAPYQYAYTMGGLPHYYTLRRNWEDKRQFRWTVKEMRKHEVVRPFYSRKQRYLDVNGFQYWTMDDKARDTTLINRQFCWHGAYASEFDAVARTYDLPWGRREAAEGTRRAVRDREAGWPSARHRLRHRPARRLRVPEDRPQALRRHRSELRHAGKFRLKHPDYDQDATLLRTTLEDYETTLRFDTIVAMFGAASHVVGTDVIAKARRLLAPGGRAVLTFYRDPAGFYERSGLGDVPELAPTPDGVAGTATTTSLGCPRWTIDGLPTASGLHELRPGTGTLPPRRRR